MSIEYPILDVSNEDLVKSQRIYIYIHIDIYWYNMYVFILPLFF